MSSCCFVRLRDQVHTEKRCCCASKMVRSSRKRTFGCLEIFLEIFGLKKRTKNAGKSTCKGKLFHSGWWRGIKQEASRHWFSSTFFEFKSRLLENVSSRRKQTFTHVHGANLGDVLITRPEKVNRCSSKATWISKIYQSNGVLKIEFLNRFRGITALIHPLNKKHVDVLHIHA